MDALVEKLGENPKEYKVYSFSPEISLASCESEIRSTLSNGPEKSANSAEIVSKIRMTKRKFLVSVRIKVILTQRPETSREKPGGV